MIDAAKKPAQLVAVLNDWSTANYPFDKLSDNTPCLVRLENGMEMEAFCFKHLPCSDCPEMWTDDWITNDPRCNDKKVGRLYGEQAVVKWKALADLQTLRGGG